MKNPLPKHSFVSVCDFEVTAYSHVYDVQKEWVAQRQRGERDDTLLVGEHLHVITTGRKARLEKGNLLNPTVEVVDIERGGDVTYHGPGQLIAYPIVHLQGERKDLHRFLRDLEEVIILTLASFDVVGVRKDEFTGVWVLSSDGRLQKIASIGVAVSKWVTYHGLALNVNTDLQYFSQINPCGLDSTVMTRMADVLDTSVNMADVKAALVKSYEQVFNVSCQMTGKLG